MASLEEIRNKLKNMESRRNNATQQTTGEQLTYPFWNLQVGETCTLRFLPDKDEDNTFFWVEKQVIKMPFAGIKGQDENKPVVVQVPCVEMWGETCPIHSEIRPWYKDDTLKDLAGTYWKKRTYLFQGLVQSSDIKESETPENPIRKFIMGPQIFKLIKQALMDPDMENLPTDYTNGTDFRVNKESKSDYADYSASTWSRRDSSLNETQLSAIEQYGLFTLSDWLPKRPTEEDVAVQFDMFEASVAGELYDPAKWANYYKPYGLEYSGTAAARTTTPTTKPATTSTNTSTTSVQEAVTTNDTPFKDDIEQAEAKIAETVTMTNTAPETSKSAQDILAMIRNRDTQ